jgi:hypothetical protein
MMAYHCSTVDSSKYNLCMGKAVVLRESRDGSVESEASILTDI